jgi:hypothetical protein
MTRLGSPTFRILGCAGSSIVVALALTLAARWHIQRVIYNWSELTLSEAHRALFAALHAGDRAVVKRLIASGVRPDARNREGETALIAACRSGEIGVARDLVLRGADVNAQSCEVRTLHYDFAHPGSTPLMWATQACSTDLLRLLVGAGANFETRDAEGETALIWAARELCRRGPAVVSGRCVHERSEPERPQPYRVRYCCGSRTRGSRGTPTETSFATTTKCVPRCRRRRTLPPLAVTYVTTREAWG